MFPTDDSPDRVIATPAATTALTALAARTGGVAVLLSDETAQVLPTGARLPRGSMRLGRLTDRIVVAARADSRTRWWRHRAEIDLRPTGSGQPTALTFALSPLNEDELYAAVASGPLPRC